MKKSHVRRCIAKVRDTLSGHFVSENLGFDHITRGEVILNKTRPLAKLLFADNECSPPAILVLDGTYIYIQKSSQFKFQRRTFSMHKKRSLVKPMMIVSTSGYIVSVIGPYLADGKNNDAQILNHIIKTNTEEVRSWVKNDDIFVVDRGFRDSLPLLKEIGIKAEMPSFLQKGEKQFSTSDANKTRMITKIRWVVESVNARLKQWRFFDKVVPNTHLPHLQKYIRIVCAMLNKYKNPLSATENELNDIAVASKMLTLSSQNNRLRELVINTLETESRRWEKVDSSTINDFPSLSDEDLREITLGVYTLKLAKSYTYEHMFDGEYDLYISRELKGILEVKLQSRHTSNHKHKLWIQYDSNKINGWYCKCPAGSRIVGTCAHVASVLWFLNNREQLYNNTGADWFRHFADAAEP